MLGQQENPGSEEELILMFVNYVWDEATKNFLVSYKDGDPIETFYAHFNSHFDKDSDLDDFIAYLRIRISFLEEESKRRMGELE